MQIIKKEFPNNDLDFDNSSFENNFKNFLENLNDKEAYYNLLWQLEEIEYIELKDNDFLNYINNKVNTNYTHTITIQTDEVNIYTRWWLGENTI